MLLFRIFFLGGGDFFRIILNFRHALVREKIYKDRHASLKTQLIQEMFQKPYENI
jgi:hypothetical protein